MKSLEIGSFEAKNRLSSLLAMAERGQRIYITRRGKRVAMLSAPTEVNDSSDQASLDNVITDLREIRSLAAAGEESLKDLIEEGRRK